MTLQARQKAVVDFMLSRFYEDDLDRAKNWLPSGAFSTFKTFEAFKSFQHTCIRKVTAPTLQFMETLQAFLKAQHARDRRRSTKLQIGKVPYLQVMDKEGMVAFELDGFVFDKNGCLTFFNER